ncbi:MAG: choice-of-anchor D domain-containing protein [Terriglobia bacterium]
MQISKQSCTLVMLVLFSLGLSIASAQTVTLSTNSLKFDVQHVHTASSVRIVTLTNPGTSVLSIAKIAVSGDFTAEDSCGTTVSPNGACTIAVSFRPSQCGDATGSLTITDNATNSPQLVTLSGTGRAPIVTWAWSSLRQGFVTLLVVLLYAVGVWLIRWHMIARPNRYLLLAEICAIRARANAAFACIEKPGACEAGAKMEIDRLLQNAEALVSGLQWPDFIFWTRGQELAGFQRMHEAERQLVALLPLAPVESRMELAEQELRDANTPASVILAEKIKDALSKAADLERLRALLSECLGFLDDRVDQELADLGSLHNKTTWMIGGAILIIVTLAMALQNAVLFAAGAAGGLLSRLSRELKRADVPTDYGASWTSLFLSPVVGALAGWTGILLVVVMTDFDFLGTVFKKVDWCDPWAAFTLGIAFVLGFSERAFDGIVSTVEEKFAKKEEAEAKRPPLPGTPSPGPLKISTEPTLPAGRIEQDYEQTLSASGGMRPYTWSCEQGLLPVGLHLDATGKISGKPAGVGRFKFTITVTDKASEKVSKEFTIDIG